MLLSQTTRNLTVILILSLFCLGISQGAAGDVIRVDDDAIPGVGDGSSWILAYKFLQDALYYAEEGDEIWVAEGTYKPDLSLYDPNIIPLDQTESFRMKNRVAVYGGFEGDEILLEQRDPSSNLTYLNGDMQGNDGPGYDNYHDNCLTVVGAYSNITDWSLIDGFIITAGCADYSPQVTDRCGGFRSSGSTGMTIQNCTLTRNWANVGGGCGFYKGSDNVMKDCLITDNYGHWESGGLMIINSSPEIIDCTISDNTAYWDEGGGVYIDHENSAPLFYNCTIKDNEAVQDYGGGIYVKWGAHVVLLYCDFINNRASTICGGGLGLYPDTSAELINCSFLGNSTAKDGGAIFATGSGLPGVDLKMINCIFSGNVASRNGGGVYCTSFRHSLYTNCTFSKNKAKLHGGLSLNTGCQAEVTNCIFWNNKDIRGQLQSSQISALFIPYQSGGPYSHDETGPVPTTSKGGLLTINNTCVQGWTGYHGGTGNMGSNPLLADADGPDNIAGTEDDDLRLISYSPCKDAGDNNALPSDDYDIDEDGNYAESLPLDFFGNDRIIDDFVDMGVFEIE